MLLSGGEARVREGGEKALGGPLLTRFAGALAGGFRRSRRVSPGAKLLVGRTRVRALKIDEKRQ